MPASGPGAEVHDKFPRCLLRLRDQADEHTALDGEGLQRWIDYELEALHYGVDPEVSREELEVLIGGSTVKHTRDDHRGGHSEARDFARWGRRGGLASVRRYGTAWFSLLARRRWEKITAEALAEVFAAMNGGRS